MIKELISKTYVTLNISAHDVRLFSTKGGRVKAWGSTPLTPGLVRDGFILQPKAVGEAIDALFTSTKIPKKRVIVSITGLSFTYHILTLPRMKHGLVEEAIQRGAKREMPLPVDELYLSWQAIGTREEELDFFVLGVPRNPVDALVETLRAAAVKPYIMELKPLALARTPKQEDAIIVALEPDCFDIVLGVNGTVTTMHSVAPRGDGATAEDHVRQLADELSRTVKYHNSSHPDNPLGTDTPLLLTGQLSTDTATAELIQARVEYPVETLIPPLSFRPDFPVALYATNMGLALGETPGQTPSGFRDTKLNILAGTYGARRLRVSLQDILMYLAPIIAVGLLFPFYQANSRATAENVHLQTELSTATQELHLSNLALSKATNEARQTENMINEIVADAEGLRQEHQALLAAGGDFASNLDLVNEALPSLAKLTSIKINTDSITVEGIVDSPFTVLNYVTALEAEGFSRIRIAEIREIVGEEDETTKVHFKVDVTR